MSVAPYFVSVVHQRFTRMCFSVEVVSALDVLWHLSTCIFSINGKITLIPTQYGVVYDTSSNIFVTFSVVVVILKST